MHEKLIERLETFVSNNLPLMVSMGAKVEQYDGDQLRLCAPLSLNHNDKGTGFGGSLYCLCVMNAIGVAFMKCFEQGLDPDLVVGKAEIEYKRPVKHDPIQSISLAPDAERWKQFFNDYRDNGKAAITIEARVIENDQECVWFRGRFALVGDH